MINKTLRFGLLPLGIPLTLMWYAYALGNIMHWCGFEIRSLLTYSDAVHWIMMIFVLPNLIRQFALHFISSNMHYFGDIEHGNIVQQVQIFKPWWSYPFQLFCFFFGVTHAIHHFWVNEPFYLRQFTARNAQKILTENGIRVNDTKSLRFANRYHHSNEK